MVQTNKNKIKLLSKLSVVETKRLRRAQINDKDNYKKNKNAMYEFIIFNIYYIF